MSKQLAPIMRGYVRKSNHSLYGPCWHTECRQPTRLFAQKPFIERHELQRTRSQAMNWAIRAAHELQRP